MMQRVFGYFFPTKGDGTIPQGSTLTGKGRKVHLTKEKWRNYFFHGDFRNESRETLIEINGSVTASWLYHNLCMKNLTEEQPFEGAVYKRDRENYTFAPEGLDESMFFRQMTRMNVKCAITYNTFFIQYILETMIDKAISNDFVPLGGGHRVQLIPSLEYLHECKKNQLAAFVMDEKLLVLWGDDPNELFTRGFDIEAKIVLNIWGPVDGWLKKEWNLAAQALGVSEGTLSPAEIEAAMMETKRKTLLINPIIVGLTLTLLFSAMGLGARGLAQEIAVDGDYRRLTLLVVLPAQIFVSLFFMQIVITNIAQIIGPVNQLKKNSKFYSGKAPPRVEHDDTLPHVTIQMPVYKEGLIGVIMPTVLSLKAAMATYEMQGGSSNIFVNDDGMQLLPESEAQARRNFYQEHNIGWVARPPHNPNPEKGEKDNGQKRFVRKGKFKKASNMNYALMISNKIEEKLLKIGRHQSWAPEEEQEAYGVCLTEVLAEEEGRAWAEGNIRVGDYILLIDSDTRVPQDCLLDAATEMEQSPEVGILQYSSGVMQVTDSFFENGITFFTNLIYTAICFTVANGDVAPFVGHNAILRWSALQQVVYKDEDGYEKFWSESHVSEDFDMSLRLQVEGYIIRLGAYTGDGFKEGVSLTVYDELNRWEKYAYGCNELLFHPFRLWLTRGPLTPLFLKFITSNIRFTSKITILSYIGTYYAIGASWILTVANYFLIGWFNGHLDKYYLDSFRVFFSLILVFSALGNVSLAILRYRLGRGDLIGGLFENFKWLLLMTIFLGGISLHVSQSLLSHFFEIDMTWGATAKEVETVVFFEELPRLFKRFKITFIFCFGSAIGMIVCANYVPWQWQIRDFVPIFPLCSVVVSHFLLPIALNPALMTFTW
ncbi:glycosyl transferase family group 2-domain-containing protein [Cadophora sp. MPI-SDFR-AT-0126]|nr:glycosyl transferase family group 2-domain-containing protein [Leotiomycetes sp. MPI-SDFR-AT-0126]